MAEQICPACGCAVVGTGYEKESVVYCGEPCASSGPCECGCCAPAGELEEKK